MNSDWLARWESDHTGWHQPGGNTALRKFWPQLHPGSRVLVPLCGKSTDLLWLARNGHAVTGVELSEIAARAVFDEADIPFETRESNGLLWFQGLDTQLSVVCGDYFDFTDEPFDALFDRAALVALPPDIRPDYVRHTRQMLKPDAAQLLLTLEYDQSMANGPPYSVLPAEVKSYWPDLERVGDKNDTKNNPPKFRKAGITELIEAVWRKA